MSDITSAPAKIILLGEHAVVYGRPSIAVPISSLRAYAQYQLLDPKLGLAISAVDVSNETYFVNSTSPELDNPLVQAARLLLDYLKCSPPDAHIFLRSNIPVASGLGSGAAVTTALLRSILAILNKSLPQDELNSLVYEIEKIHHGTPSGIDNTVVVFEEPVYFVRNKPIERLTIDKPFSLLIADTGIAASTKLAVDDVRLFYESNPISVTKILDTIAELVVAGRAAIEVGNFEDLGMIMNKNHSCLQTLTVSCPHLDKLVTVAQDAGALGAKLSGGGRGGNMIALVTHDSLPSVKSGLLNAGAASIYETIIG